MWPVEKLVRKIDSTEIITLLSFPRLNFELHSRQEKETEMRLNLHLLSNPWQERYRNMCTNKI